MFTRTTLVENTLVENDYPRVITYINNKLVKLQFFYYEETYLIIKTLILFSFSIIVFCVFFLTFTQMTNKVS